MFDVKPTSTPSHLEKLSRDLSLTLPTLLPAHFVRDAIAKAQLDFRVRVFSPVVTIYGMLIQVFCDDKSARHAVALVKSMFAIRQAKTCSSKAASYIKAKMRLPLIFFRALFDDVSALLEGSCPSAYRWKHGPVKIVDGTGFSMPDTKANLTRYPRYSRPPMRDTGFPVGRLLTVFSMTSGGIVDAVIGPCKGKGSGELSLLQQVWQSWKKGETLLGDSLFASYWVVAKAASRGIHVVAEFPRRQRAAIFKKKSADFFLTLYKPAQKSPCLSEAEYASLPSQITVRIVRLRCAPKGFRPTTKLILTTHLDCGIVTPDDILGLYKRRWQVEVNLRSIKIAMGMDILRSKSPEAIEREIWAYIIGYNIARLAMLRAAKLTKRLPEEISFRSAQQAVGILLVGAALGCHSPVIAQSLLQMVADSIVGQNPDRFEPRAIKRRKKNFAFLSEPRELSRRKLCKKHKRCKAQAA